MAGNYPDVPGIKFQYDVDGSAGFFINPSGTLSALTGGQMTGLSGEAGTAQVTQGIQDSANTKLGIIFPELRDITGVLHGISYAGNTNGGWQHSFYTSVNTTNGLDGTWVAQTTPTRSTNFRTGIQTYALTGIKAVREDFTQGQSFPQTFYNMLHIYGSIPTIQSPDRLRFWHATLDQEMAGPAFDYGDFGRTGTIDRTFRIKNNSSSLTANSIVLSRDAITDTTPTVVSQMSISQGGSFATTQNIGALAPGAISGVCTLRIATSGSTTLSIWRQRIVATAGSWT